MSITIENWRKFFEREDLTKIVVHKVKSYVLSVHYKDGSEFYREISSVDLNYLMREYGFNPSRPDYVILHAGGPEIGYLKS